MIEGIQSLGKITNKEGNKKNKKQQDVIIENYLKMREEEKKKLLKHIEEQNKAGRQAMSRMTVEQMKEFLEITKIRNQFLLDLLEWTGRFCNTMAELILSGHSIDPAVIKEFFARATQARDSAVSSLTSPDADDSKDLPKDFSTEESVGNK